MLMHIILQGLFRYNITANETPWNTTGNYSFYSIPTLITKNIPFFFPLITLMLLLATDYIFALKKGVDTRSNFFAVALVYTILSYVEVVGNLSTSGYFYMFEFIMVISVFLITLFTSQQG